MQRYQEERETKALRSTDTNKGGENVDRRDIQIENKKER